MNGESQWMSAGMGASMGAQVSMDMGSGGGPYSGYSGADTSFNGYGGDHHLGSDQYAGFVDQYGDQYTNPLLIDLY